MPGPVTPPSVRTKPNVTPGVMRKPSVFMLAMRWSADLTRCVSARMLARCAAFSFPNASISFCCDADLVRLAELILIPSSTCFIKGCDYHVSIYRSARYCIPPRCDHQFLLGFPRPAKSAHHLLIGEFYDLPIFPSLRATVS